MNQELNHPEVSELVSTVSFFSSKGWIPATSSNFSLRINTESLWISKSGVDKSQFSEKDLMQVDLQGNPLPNETNRPSAETLIHTAIYKFDSHAKVVLHTHGLHSTIVSMELENEGRVSVSGFELLKIFPKTNTHDTQVDIAIRPNSQDMVKFSQSLEKELNTESYPNCFLIAGHGLYTWGETVLQAKAITEAVEHLLECKFLRGKLKGG